MNEEYPIVLAGETVGSAKVKRQGLYWKICCRCKLPGEVVYKVILCCQNREADLGVLVPGPEGFEIETSLPVKKVGTGGFSFRAVPRHAQVTRKFVPIYPEEPFSYLERLKEAYLEVRNGQVGVMLPQTTDPA